MLNIDTAKAQASALEQYLKTIGKNLKHTHALEAIARINGHKSWNAYQAAASSAAASPATSGSAAPGADPAEAKLLPVDLAELFLKERIGAVHLDHAAYAVRYYNSEVLGNYEDIVQGKDDEYDMQSVCIELERVESGLVWEELITVEQLSNAQHQSGTKWLMGDGSALELALFTQN